VIERRRRAGLVLEPGEPAGIGREGDGQHLDGDVAPQARVTRTIVVRKK
jgi:hypothetical protein